MRHQRRPQDHRGGGEDLGRENGGVNARDVAAGDVLDWPEDFGWPVAGDLFPAEAASAEGMSGDFQRALMASVTGEDWPTIIRAHEAASRGDWRGLLALDREWGARPGRCGKVAEASYRAGQRQLGRMRPMRDVRVVQRYLEAVEAGTARGWHPVVYGMVLAVHSIPLRQGLAHHAMRMASVMARALPTGKGREGRDAPLREAFESEVAARMPQALDRVLGAGMRLTLG